MNNLEEKFYKYLKESPLLSNVWGQEKLATDLAKIAYKNEDERVRGLKEMYNIIGKLCIKFDRENAELKKKLE